MWILLLFTLAYTSKYQCQFKLPDGNLIDLSSLYTDVPDYEMDSMDFVYRANICGDTHKTCGSEAGIVTQWEYNGKCVAVLARQGPTAPVATYIDPLNPDAGIRLTYKNGNICGGVGQRQVVYNIHCSNEVTRITLAQEYRVCEYTFEVYTRDICPGKAGVPKKSKSLSTLTWILIITTIIIVLYCIIGALLNKKHNPELPIFETIPNKHFWQEIPSLVSTSVQYTVEKSKDMINRVTGREY